MAPRDSAEIEREARKRSRRSASPRDRHRSSSDDRKREEKRSPHGTHASPSPKAQDPPLPDEPLPPLPDEPVPTTASPSDGLDQAAGSADDGWEAHWDANVQTYYFYNRFTQATQWTNPRVPEATTGSPSASAPAQPPGHRTGAAGGYNPAIHGDYDPNADYAQGADVDEEDAGQNELVEGAMPPDYTATASFNKFTNRFTNTNLHPTHTPGAHTDDAKARRQMNAFFDVDAAANERDGRSLKAERQNRKLTKQEVKAYRERAKHRKEEKRRAWLRD